MNGAKGSALEWALALLRAPSERHVLRQRPLPRVEMDLLLGIAAGAAPEILAEQAKRFGESEARVVEAARFYAREVLFYPQASAYRVLGVEPGASAEVIKAHHRQLQLWLHPDRARNEDDAVFAARVNGAWNRLRSPERRKAYDEALRAERPPEIFDSGETLHGVRTWVPAVEPVALPSPWRRRAPVLALLGLCGVLVLLALRDMSRTDADWATPQSPAAGAADIELIAPQTPRTGGEVGLSSQPALPPERSAAGVPRVAAAASPLEVPNAGRRPDLQASLAAPRPQAIRPAAGGASAAGVSAGPEATRAARPVAPARSASQPSPMPSSVPPIAARTGAPPASGAAPLASAPQVGHEFARVQSARLTGEQLLDYLSTPRRAVPPIWSSPAVEEDTLRLRYRLHAGARVRLAAPRWRIGDDEAVLESAVAVSGAPARNEQITARLRWRDGYWLVTGVDMEPIR